MQPRSFVLLAFAACLGCGRVSREHASASTGGSASAIDDAGSAAGTPGISEAGAAGATDAASDVTAEPTWRLTNVEYSNTVQDLLGLTSAVALAPDGAAAGYSAGQEAGDPEVLDYHQAAIQLAADAVKNVSRLAPCTASDASPGAAACAAKFIDSFAPKAFRRPIDADTRAALSQFYAAVAAKFGFASGIQALLEEMLQSPYFLYHLELEERDLGFGVVPVSGYSMAARLSYLLWASMPDDELFTQAAAGALSAPEQIRAQALRMLADPKAKLGLQNFYEQWLGARELPTSKGGVYAATYNDVTRESVLVSFRAQTDAALWAEAGGLSALLAGNQAYADGNVASLLGVSLSPGAPLQAVTVNSAQRLGILTHPAIMGAHATNLGTRPISRSVFVWDRILCQTLPDPPPGEPPLPPIPPHASVRQTYEASDSSTRCQSCHARIDPVGFLFENYDSLGAYRTVDDVGQPVDPAVTIVGASDPALNGAAANAVAFVKRLAASDQVSQCLVDQLFRYASKREEGSLDQAFLADLATQYVRSGQSMKQVLSALTQSRTFLHRLNEE